MVRCRQVIESAVILLLLDSFFSRSVNVPVLGLKHIVLGEFRQRRSWLLITKGIVNEGGKVLAIR